MRFPLAIFLFLCLNVGALGATVRVKSYVNQPDENFRVFNKMYLDGARDGLESANAALINSGEKALYCLPANFVLTIDQTEDMVVRWVKRQTKDTSELPVTIALLLVLQEAFPCSGANNR